MVGAGQSGIDFSISHKSCGHRNDKIGYTERTSRRRYRWCRRKRLDGEGEEGGWHAMVGGVRGGRRGDINSHNILRDGI